jgi:hypothetical protein
MLNNRYDQQTKLTSIADIRANGFTYATVNGSAPQAYMLTSPTVSDIRGQMVAYPNLDAAVAAVRDKSVDSLIWSNTIIDYYV